MSQDQASDFFRDFGVLCGVVTLENGNIGFLYVQPERPRPIQKKSRFWNRTKHVTSSTASQEGSFWAITRIPTFDLLDQEWEDFDFEFAVSRWALLSDVISAKEIFGREVTWITDEGVVAAIKKIYLNEELTAFICADDSLPEFRHAMISDLFDLVGKIPVTRYRELLSLLKLLDQIPSSSKNPELVLPFQNHKYLVQKRRETSSAVNVFLSDESQLSESISRESTIDSVINQLQLGGFMLSVSRYQPGANSGIYLND